MALLSELVAVCEEHWLDKASTLNHFARRLREAGRLSQKGRGRGAAHITFVDAARFLIACAATDHPEQAVEAERTFSNTIEVERTTLEEEFATLLRDISARKIAPALEIGDVMVLPSCSLTVHRSSVAATLRIKDERKIFHTPSAWSLMHHKNSNHSRRANICAEMQPEILPFRTGKNLTAELGINLFWAVANLIGRDGRSAA